MAKQKPKRYYTRTIDLLFLLVFLIVSIVSFYIAFTFGILPVKWTMAAAGILLLIFLILFMLSMKKLPKWAVIVKRLFIILLTVMIGTGGYFLDKSRSTLHKMSKNAAGSTTEIYVVVKKGSGIDSLSQLEGKTIGYQKGVDKINAAYAKEQVDKEVSNTTAKDELDYTTLYSDLNLETVNAFVISDSYYDMSKSNIDGFADNVDIIQTYKRKNDTASGPDIDVTKDTFTVYLSGLDNMGSPDQQTRSDTNLILIVNPKANHIDMVSLPRDGYIPNAAYNYQNDKLTHTGNDGIENSVETIQNFFGIPIDYYARVSFNSLIEIVDTIGGIDVDVEIDFCEQDENRSFKKEDLICLKKGKQHLNGKQALAYSRHRKTKGYDNAGRERAQQRIIKAIINKLISANGLTKVNDLMDIAPNYIITNMPAEKIADFVSGELNELKPWTISSITSDNGVYEDLYVASLDPSLGASNVYLFSRDEVHAVVNAYDGARKQLKLNSFAFDLNNLYANTPNINTSENIRYADMAQNPQ
ncbi:LCP family protein [[Clostridium] innocuum]|nr:LCP family protein [[Clostridium] innocuum]